MMTSKYAAVRIRAFEGMGRMFEHEPIHILENMYGLSQNPEALLNPFQDRPNLMQAAKYAGGMGHMAKAETYMMDTYYKCQER